MPTVLIVATSLAAAGGVYAGVVPRQVNMTAGGVLTASSAPADILSSTQSTMSYQSATSSLGLASPMVESIGTTYMALVATPLFSYDPLPPSSAARSSTPPSIHQSPSAMAHDSSRISASDANSAQTHGTTTLSLYTTVAAHAPSRITPHSGANPANATMIRSSGPTTSFIGPSSVAREPAGTDCTRRAQSTPPSVTSSAIPREGLFTYSVDSHSPVSSSDSAYLGSPDETSVLSSNRPASTVYHSSMPTKASDGKVPSSSIGHPWSSGWHHPHNPFQYKDPSTPRRTTISTSVLSSSAQPSAYASASEITSAPSSFDHRSTGLPDVVMKPSLSSSASQEDTEATLASTSATIPGITIVPVNPDAVTIWMTTTVTEAGLTTTVSA